MLPIKIIHFLTYFVLNCFQKEDQTGTSFLVKKMYKYFLLEILAAKAQPKTEKWIKFLNILTINKENYIPTEYDEQFTSNSKFFNI